MLKTVCSNMNAHASSSGAAISGLNSFPRGSDDDYMVRAIELASKASGRTSPNPLVGCVIVGEDGDIVGEGWHRKAGDGHAEVEALKTAGELAIGSTAYISLEPCNHFGRTPPCTHALIKAGIKRVVAGMVDPDSRVSGKGLSYLKEKGLDVKVGTQEKACQSLNAPFIYRVLHNSSYLTIWTNEKVAHNRGDDVKIFLRDVFMRQLRNSVPNSVDTIILTLNQIFEIKSRLLNSKISAQNDNIASIFQNIPDYITIVIADIEEDYDKYEYEQSNRNSIEFGKSRLASARKLLKQIKEKKNGNNLILILQNNTSSISEKIEINGIKEIIIPNNFVTLESALNTTSKEGCNSAICLVQNHTLIKQMIKNNTCQRIWVNNAKDSSESHSFIDNSFTLINDELWEKKCWTP